MTATLSRTHVKSPSRPPSDTAADMGRPAERRQRRRWPWLVGVVLVAALTTAHLVLGHFMRVPIIQPDELGYINNAHYLTRGGLKPSVQYYPGFSLLLMPVWLFTKDPLHVWRAALVINSVLAGAGGVVTWTLCGRLAPNLTGWRRLLVTATVCAYPAFLLFSNLALSECLFALLFGVTVLLAGRAFAGGSNAWWAATGVATGSLALVHPRGYAVVIAIAVMAFVSLRPWAAGPDERSVAARASSLLTLAAGTTLSLGITQLLVSSTRGGTIKGFVVYQPDSIISKSLSAHGAASLVWEIAGQFFYLSVATAGLVPLGLFFGLRSLHAAARRQRPDRSPATMARAFAAVAFLGVWALSSLFMNLGERADKLIYGRYNEGVIAPLLVIALAEILAPERLRRFSSRAFAARRWLVVGAFSIGASGAGLAYGRTTAQLHGEYNPINTLGLFSILHHYSGAINVLGIAVAGIGALALLAVVSWKLPSLAAVVLAAAFVGTAVHAQASYLVPGTRARAEQNVMAGTIGLLNTDLEVTEPCIGYDATAATAYNFFATSFLLPDQNFEWFDATSGAAPCGPLVISGHRDFATHYPGARIVTFEQDVDEALWALPGPVQDQLDLAGWLLPAQTPGVLPEDARHASLTVAPKSGGTASPTVIAAGAVHKVQILATHDHAGAPWPDEAGLGQGTYAVRLVADWFTPDSLPGSAAQAGSPVSTIDVALPRTVLPGETAEITLPLTARAADGTALPPGNYKVRVVMLQEQAPSFTDPGLVLDVTVR